MRQVQLAENVSADVEGDIEDVEGVLRITRIRLRFHLMIPADSREKVDRAVATYAEKCPAYQSVKDCIDVSWHVEIEGV